MRPLNLVVLALCFNPYVSTRSASPFLYLHEDLGGIPILNQPKKVKVKNLVSPKYSDPSQTVLKFKVEPHSNTYDINLTD